MAPPCRMAIARVSENRAQLLPRKAQDRHRSARSTAAPFTLSRRIREEFDNGREYYRLEGTPIREPREQIFRPTVENLEYHATQVFR
jgi:hypothetical protein